MSVSIRSAALDDLPAILAIEQAAPTAAHWTAEQYQTRIEDGCVLIAESAGKVCGFLCTRVVGSERDIEWELENVVIAAQFLRQGIADQLMQSLIAQAEAAGASSILLEVRESNVPARKLYEKHGFREVGRRPRYYSNPLDDAVLYACPSVL